LPSPRWNAPTSWTCRRLSSSARAAILVEGTSDLVAIEALADHRGVDLDAAGVTLVPMGGAQAIGRFLDVFVPQGLRLAGLCDAAEEGEFMRGLERAGLGSNLTRGGMEEIGFFVCVEDLEDELIRAHGVAAVEEVIEAEGDLGSFRTLQKQPAWEGRPVEEQLRRFMGSGGSRKIRYARRLVDALDPAKIPRPLEGVLAHVT
jgi:Overcoming lysogenization defect protein-like, TOPRIM domain